MKEIDCVLVGHYSLSISKQIQLAEMAFGKNSRYYHDALEKSFLIYKNKKYTVSQLYNLFYSNGSGDLSFDHVTFEHSFNTAIANIGTYLIRNGFTIDFANTFNKDKKRLASILSQNKVLTIAIPTTFYVSSFPIAQIISFIRKYNKEAKIIVGGPFIRNIVSTYLQNDTELAKNLIRLGADFYVSNNDGEETLAQLIEAVKNDKPTTGIPNLYYYIENCYRFTYPEVKSNSFPYRMTDWSYFKDCIPEMVNIRTTKSCPFDCAFCGLPVVGGKWKTLPLKELELELRCLHNINHRTGIFFIDETLNFPSNRFKEMLRLMIRNNFQFKWEAELRCDILDRETLELMRESGCQLVHLGIESGNQDVLNNMSKKVDVKDYHRAMELLHEFEIMTCALIVVGFPGETRETFRDTFDFIESYKPTFFRVHRWFYDHDTPVHQKKEQYKLNGKGYNWTHYTMDSVIAHELSTELSLNPQNSIHTDDYPMAFYLLNKGYKKEKVCSFLKLFDLAIKEKSKEIICNQKIESYIDQLKTVLI